jgi:AcrR family transcriptional regulator
VDSTKQEIILQAEQLFSTFGIRKVKMSDIAKQMGVSKKTLYQYFTTKEDLIHEVVKQKLTHMEQCISAQINQGENAIEEVIAIFKTVIKNIGKANPEMLYDLKLYYPEVYAHFESFREHEIQGNFMQNMGRGIKEGVYREGMNLKLIAALYMHMIEFISGPQLSDIETDFSKRYAQVFLYHLHGLCTSKGYQLLQQYEHQLKLTTI